MDKKSNILLRIRNETSTNTLYIFFKFIAPDIFILGQKLVISSKKNVSIKLIVQKISFYIIKYIKKKLCQKLLPMPA